MSDLIVVLLVVALLVLPLLIGYDSRDSRDGQPRSGPGARRP
jgi:hypothetical protein